MNVSLSKICEKYSRFKPCRDSTSQSVRCAHGVGKVCTVAKDGANKGRQFYTCSKSKTRLVVTQPIKYFLDHDHRVLGLKDDNFLAMFHHNLCSMIYLFSKLDVRSHDL